MFVQRDMFVYKIIQIKIRVSPLFLHLKTSLRHCHTNLELTLKVKLSMYSSPLCVSTFNGHSRSSIPEVFCKKCVLRNFAKFTGKHLCQSLFFNKVSGVRPAILLKKRLWHRCFPVNFAKFLRTLSQNTSGGCFCHKYSLK